MSSESTESSGLKEEVSNKAALAVDKKRKKKKKSDFSKFFSSLAFAFGKGESEKHREKRKKASKEARDLTQKINIFRWIYHCFTTHATSPQVTLNQVLAPAPSLGAYYLISQTINNWTPFTIPFDIDENDVKNLTARLASAPEWRPAMFAYLRAIVDDDESITVSARLMNSISEIMKQQVFITVAPSKVNRHLTKLTGHEVALPQPPRLTTSIYATAGVTAKWKHPDKKPELLKEAFACGINERQEHDFVAMTVRAAITKMQGHGEAWWIPIGADSADCALVFIRPFFVGGLLDLKASMRGEVLQAVLHNLQQTELKTCELLLPCFQVETRRDLWSKWIKGVIQKSEELDSFPPLSSLWHFVTVSLDKDGIAMNFKKDRRYKPLGPKLLKRISKECLWKEHRTFTGRIDSPFIFMICHRSTALPIIAGSYSGTPPAAALKTRIRAPDRYAHLS